MNTEIVSQKERFLQEVEQKLLHRELDARLLEEGGFTSNGRRSRSARLTETASSVSDQRILRGRKWIGSFGRSRRLPDRSKSICGSLNVRPR